MRVVVTGALGHIGSRLIREFPLGCPGASIVMLDNLATRRYDSLEDLPATGRYEFIEGDVLTADLARVFEGADAVIHLAAQTHSAGGAASDQMDRVNLHGSERVAQACLATGSALLFPSTTSVYGTPSGVVAEDGPASDLVPQTPYAAGKLHTERLIQAHAQHDGLRCAIFRMGTIFGPSPGMRFHTAVNQFCWRAVAGQPIEVWRTALHQFRPYLDLSDAVRAILFVVNGRHFDGRIYNVLTLNATVQQVIDSLTTYVPAVRVDYVDSALMNELSYLVDTARFTGLGFQFTGALDSGIGETVAMLQAARSLAAPSPTGHL